MRLKKPGITTAAFFPAFRRPGPGDQSVGQRRRGLDVEIYGFSPGLPWKEVEKAVLSGAHIVDEQIDGLHVLQGHLDEALLSLPQGEEST
jgi:hypothetical protein